MEVNQEKLSGRLLIKDKDTFYNIPTDEVIWIQSDGNYITVHTDSRKYVIKQSLRKMLDILNDDRFVKVQKRYIVRADLIDTISTQRDEISLQGKIFPIGRSFKEQLLNRFQVLR